MHSYWSLLDILKFLNRDDLERIQTTNRMLNGIVMQEFATHPLRIHQAHAYVQIRSNKLFVLLYKNEDDSYFAHRGRKWIINRGLHYCLTQNCDHYQAINVMRPFLCKNVRFRYSTITINDSDIFTPFTADHIATLESISHIWTAQRLYFNYFSEHDSSFLSLILGSSSVLQCSVFAIQDNRNRIEMLQNPIIYSLSAVVFNQFYNMSAEEIFQVIRQKTVYPNSGTILVYFGKKESIELAIETAKQDFLRSENRCRLYLIIVAYSSIDILEFRLLNICTNEQLEFKQISRENIAELQLMSFFRPAYLLKRHDT